MPYEPKEIPGSAPNLLAVIREVVEATKKTSPGGVKITPAEWLEIGEQLGILAANVVKDVVD